MRVSVIQFPGTNCDHDIQYLYGSLLDSQVELIWHRETDLREPELVVLPGGFSYGDYLRCGALAKLSPIMKAVRTFADNGGKVLGICNGFQILCEAGLLPGVLLANRSRRFLSQFIHLRVGTRDSFFTHSLGPEQVLRCPVAHFEGNYFVHEDQLQQIEENDQVVFRYCSPSGDISNDSEIANPNGSRNSIAGVCSKERNVIGFMPHPERSVENITSNGFQGIQKSLFCL